MQRRRMQASGGEEAASGVLGSAAKGVGARKGKFWRGKVEVREIRCAASLETTHSTTHLCPSVLHRFRLWERDGGVASGGDVRPIGWSKQGDFCKIALTYGII
jgi:hypothetical protein